MNGNVKMIALVSTIMMLIPGNLQSNVIYESILNGTYGKQLQTNITFTISSEIYTLKIRKMPELTRVVDIMTNGPNIVSATPYITNPFGDRLQVALLDKKKTIEMTISKLLFEDDGINMTIQFMAGGMMKPTTNYVVVNVAGEPERCDLTKEDFPLKSMMTVNESESLTSTVYLCGNPKPTVNMKFGDSELNVTSTSISGKHSYKYEAVVSDSFSRKDCGKILKYSSYNTINNETSSKGTNIIVNFKPEPQNVIVRQYYDSITAVWDPIESGECQITYQVVLYGEKEEKNSTTDGNSTTTSTTISTTVQRNDTNSTEGSVSTTIATTVSRNDTNSTEGSFSTTITTTVSRNDTNSTEATTARPETTSVPTNNQTESNNTSSNNTFANNILFLNDGVGKDLIILKAINITPGNNNLLVNDTELLAKVTQVAVVGIFGDSKASSKPVAPTQITTTTTTTTTTTITTTTPTTTTTTPTTTTTIPTTTTTEEPVTPVPTEPTLTTTTTEQSTPKTEESKDTPDDGSQSTLIAAIAGGCGLIVLVILICIFCRTCCKTEENDTKSLQMKSIHEYDVESNGGKKAQNDYGGAGEFTTIPLGEPAEKVDGEKSENNNEAPAETNVGIENEAFDKNQENKEEEKKVESAYASVNKNAKVQESTEKTNNTCDKVNEETEKPITIPIESDYAVINDKATVEESTKKPDESATPPKDAGENKTTPYSIDSNGSTITDSGISTIVLDK